MLLQRVRTTLLPGLLLLLGACTSRPASTGGDQPVATVGNVPIIRITEQTLAAGSSDTVRFGRMHAGEIAVQQLWLANETDRPLVPADYRTSCGCTTLDFENQPIQPGYARPATLTFNSSGEWGWQFKRLDLKLAGAEKKVLIFVEAEVR